MSGFDWTTSSLKQKHVMGGQVAKYVFMPPKCTYTETKPWQITWLPTKTDKKVPAYWLCHKKRKTDTTILYSHGNAADIGGMFEFLVLLYEHVGVNVLHYDYLGYGLTKESYGFPSEESTYESIEAAHKFLHSQGIENKDIIVMGTSVGSGPTCHLASLPKEKPFLGVILECPFVSCIRVVTNNILLRPIDMFVNINKVGKFNCPTFILHGSVDQVIAQDHGRELYENLPEKFKYAPQWIDGADHHDIIDRLGVENYIKHFRDFVLFCKELQGGKTLKSVDSVKIILKVKEDVSTGFDQNKPCTNIQVKLLDGNKLKGTFNYEQKVSHVFKWVNESTGISSDVYTLLYTPNQMSSSRSPLLESSKTIEDAQIGGSMLIMGKK